MKLAFCLALLVMLATAPGAQAARVQEGPPLSAEELDAQVGGFRTPGGLEIGFGAVVSTYVDGQLALQTRLTWTDHGPETTTTTTASGSADAASGGIHIAGLPGMGVYLPGTNGGTAVMHDLTDTHIGSLIFNTADNRDIRTDTTITLDIPNLDQMQRDITSQQIDMRLQDMVGRALTDALN